MPPGLDEYRAKRNPRRTPEPVPAGKGRTPRRRSGAAAPSFVIQEHHARALHWDFRLERDGVLVSWALPKGLPADPKRNHLAVPTEDHPLEYASFAGEIPAGEYGGGRVAIWDRGTYECTRWTDTEVKVHLHGERVDARFALFRTGRAGRDAGREQWMIHREDPPAEGFDPLPELVRPMLCATGDTVPEGEGWAYEFKWDGVRTVVTVDGGRVKVVTRNDNDVTVSYPELRALGEAMGSLTAVLDGEIVALDAAGRPSFEVLQQRMHVASAPAARRLAASVPVSYLVFDVLYLDGRSTISLPYDDRRALLASLDLSGPHWATPEPVTGVPGHRVLEVAGERGLEGVVAKRRDSTYQPGRRSEAWVKVKHFVTQEVLIGGWTAGKGNRDGAIGALLLGVPGPGGLDYVGKVGTGFTRATLNELAAALAPLEAASHPFSSAPPRSQTAGAHWVRPELVGEVRYVERTRDRRLRAPSWRGLRPDKDPAEVHWEG